jgi:hypothetical protein
LFFRVLIDDRIVTEPIPTALESGFETSAIKRFEEVICGLNLERLDGGTSIRGDDDENGEMRAMEAIHHRETVKTGHTQVEEDNIGTGLLNRLQSRSAIGAFADDFDVRFGSEKFAEVFTTKRFVFSYEHAYLHDLLGWDVTGSGWACQY